MKTEKEQWEELYECMVNDAFFKDIDMPKEVPQTIKQAIGMAYENGWDACYNFYTLKLD